MASSVRPSQFGAISTAGRLRGYFFVIDKHAVGCELAH